MKVARSLRHAANRERDNENARRWAAEHPDQMREYKRRFRAAHPEKLAEEDRLYRETHRDVKNAVNRAYKARRRAAEGTHAASDIAAQHERQRGRCFWCNARVGDAYHVDHVVPLCRGGSNGPENLVVSCPRCNQSKGAQHPADFAGVML